MRLRLLRPPPVTVHLDLAYRIEPLWMEAAQSGYLAAYFVGGHWKLTPNHAPRSALDSAWSNGTEILDSPWPTAIARALIQAGLAEALSPV